MQILVWAVGVLTVVVGLKAIQAARIANHAARGRKGPSDDGLGVVIAVISILGAGFVIWAAHEQASSISDLTGF